MHSNIIADSNILHLSTIKCDRISSSLFIESFERCFLTKQSLLLNSIILYSRAMYRSINRAIKGSTSHYSHLEFPKNVDKQAQESATDTANNLFRCYNSIYINKRRCALIAPIIDNELLIAEGSPLIALVLLATFSAPSSTPLPLNRCDFGA